MRAKRMLKEELLEEVQWLLDGGMSPVYICEVMQRTPSSISKAAWRAGNKRIEYLFARKEAEIDS